MADKPQAVRVLYCDVCNIPMEYCEFSPNLEKCKPRLRTHSPDMYPDPQSTINSFDSNHCISRAGSVSASKQEEVKRLIGGKIKKKILLFTPLFIIYEIFLGVKLSDASKKRGKKFAIGAYVVKGPTEKE
ncbi:hypothetical protein ZIOFF_009959 [Zingiber officinale]|uniref:DENR N-terminal domain-containing protein n=1 Tax=Zingiber officinale TaxID=94328 RepID=A0A8J5LP27_ZINOF|nr:hypothetical protein ZIOFF_009959 [Zingiber officinale]